MKKILSIFLVISLLASFATTIFAATSADILICHNLTCDGQKVYTAQPGEEIKVILTFETSNGEPVDIKNIQSEVAYDTDFFELADDEDIKVLASPVKREWQKQESKHYEYRVFAVFAMFQNTQEGLLHCESSQAIAEYTLKVKDTAQTGDSGFVKSLVGEDVNVFGPDFEQYGESASDLTVVIGTPATTYKLTYMNGTEQFAVSEVTGNAKIINGPTPADGLVFLGWKDSNGKLWKPGDDYTPSADMTFKATWSEPIKYFTLTFDTNGGDTIASVEKAKGTVVDLSSYTPTRSGYDFEGWFSDEALTNKVTSIKMDSDKTVYAKWDKVNTGGGTTVTKYTLSFDTNGGSNINSVSKARNTTVNLSEYITTKSGYSFVGWCSDKELTKKVTEITLNRDMTVYAKWVVSEDKPIVEKPDYKPSILTDEHYAYIVGREGGMIAPESDITRAEVATIIYRLLDEDERNKVKTKENVFTDVNEGDWFNTAVSTLASLELVKGRTTDTFAPNNFITRAELATIFARMVEVEYDGKVLFSDVSGHWAESYINEAATAEWIVGYNGLFRPDDNITRAEVMTLVNRVLNREPENKADLLNGMTTWKDNADENAWYYLAVQEATNSHACDMKADGKHEKWTSLTENPNWSKIED